MTRPAYVRRVYGRLWWPYEVIRMASSWASVVISRHHTRAGAERAARRWRAL